MTELLARPATARLTQLWELTGELVRRDVRLRYKRSVLGIFWSLLNPLLQLLVFTVIFGLILALNIPHYPLFLFVGLLAWNWLQAALTEATGAVVDNRELVRRPGFPAVILPVVPVLTNLVHLVLALPVLGLFLVLGGVGLQMTALLLPLVLAVQAVLMLGLAYVVAALNVSFRDVRYILSFVLLLGFYLSPIIYDPATIPARWQAVYYLNPMATVIDAYRAVLFYGTLPNFGALALVTLLGLAVLWLGVRLFERKSIHFAEEI